MLHRPRMEQHRSHPPFLLAPGYFQLYEATVAQCANGR